MVGGKTQIFTKTVRRGDQTIIIQTDSIEYLEEQLAKIDSKEK